MMKEQEDWLKLGSQEHFYWRLKFYALINMEDFKPIHWEKGKPLKKLYTKYDRGDSSAKGTMF